MTSKDELLKIKVDTAYRPMYHRDMQKRSSKKGLDINILAQYITNAVTGQEAINKFVTDGKNPAAVLLGHLGGLKGGKARAARLSAEKRIEIAKKAARARWKNEKLKAK